MQSPINEVDAIAAAGIEAALESPTVFQGVEDPIGDHNEDKYDDQNNKIDERLMPVATTVFITGGWVSIAEFVPHLCFFHGELNQRGPS